MKNKQLTNVELESKEAFKQKETLVIERHDLPYEEMLRNYYSDMETGERTCPDELELAFFFEELFDLITLECENDTIH